MIKVYINQENITKNVYVPNQAKTDRNEVSSIKTDRIERKSNSL